MHDVTVIHRDLKLENILVDDKMKLKIIDFGFSTYNDNMCDVYCGTLPYMAPEIIENKPFDGHAADIFAVGVIMFILVTGSFPFTQATSSNKFYNSLNSDSEKDRNKFWLVTESTKCSDEFKELFAAMVTINPEERPSLK